MGHYEKLICIYYILHRIFHLCVCVQIYIFASSPCHEYHDHRRRSRKHQILLQSDRVERGSTQATRLGVMTRKITTAM